jgi:hypothetical protein
LDPGKSPAENYLNSNKQEIRASLRYTKQDIEHVEKWGKSVMAASIRESLLTGGD